MSKKNTILRHATTLFARKGFKGTSMTEVSRMSGVASGTIFYHYDSKEALLLAILTRVKEVILREFDRYERECFFRNGLEEVQGIVSYYLGLAANMEDEFLLLHRHFPYQMAETNPTYRNHLEAIYNCLVDIIERAIKAGQRDGSIGRMHSHKTALILFSAVDGIVRFNTYQLYDAGTLYQELLDCCGRILEAN